MRWRDEIEKKGVKVGVVSAAVIVTLINDLYNTIVQHSALLPKNGHNEHHKRIAREINKLYKHKEYLSNLELQEFAELVMIKAQMDVDKLLDGCFFDEARDLVRKVEGIAVRLDFHRFIDWGKEKIIEITFAEDYFHRNLEHANKLI